ncbi:response regulator transcription factor, partial [Nodularia spumigena]
MFQILVIDDDISIQTLLKRMLEKQGYKVVAASNGEEGIAQAIAYQPALVICDWIMPGLNGLEVCKRMKTDPNLST